MTINMTELGIYVPGDIDPDREPFDVILDHIDETGMVYELHWSRYDDGMVIVGAYHDDVGLVSWYRLGSQAQAREWIAS